MEVKGNCGRFWHSAGASAAELLSVPRVAANVKLLLRGFAGRQAAARVDALIERLRVYGNRMQGKFVKKLTDYIFELRGKQFGRIFRVLFFYQPGMLIVITSGFQKKTEQTPRPKLRGRAAKKALDEVPKPLHGIAEGKRSDLEGVGPTRQTVKSDRHSEIVEQGTRQSASYRKTFARTLHQIDLALLVSEMREDADLTQSELAWKVGTTQSVIARLEDAEYTGHSLTMLKRIATACGVALKLHAEKKPNFDREVALV